MFNMTRIKSNEKIIGLVSFYKDPNYGTQLQAYALSATILKLGKQCEYINFRNHPKSTCIYLIIKKTVRRFLIMIGLLKDNYEFSYYNSSEFCKIKKGYEFFSNNYIPISSRVYYKNTLQNANNVYEKFIIGSDQTWSKFMTLHLGHYLFLDFVDDNKKKCAYAPSIGTIHIDEDFKIRLRQKLSSFYKLSCREPENSKLLSEILDRNVCSVLDPTLLLNNKDWLSITDDAYVLPDTKYILCYILGEKDCISLFAEELGRRENIPVYYILTRPKYLNKMRVLNDVCPRRFIKLISEAEYVVTDSFHGTIFSINLHTNFYSFAKRKDSEGFNDNDRIVSFLKILGIENRFQNDLTPLIQPNIEFDKIDQKLESLRVSSISYLKEIIND